MTVVRVRGKRGVTVLQPVKPGPANYVISEPKLEPPVRERAKREPVQPGALNGKLPKRQLHPSGLDRAGLEAKLAKLAERLAAAACGTSNRHTIRVEMQRTKRRLRELQKVETP